MADVIWNGTGGTNGDLNDAANYTPSGLPTTGDNLRFTANYTQSITSNMAALTGVVLGDVVFEEGYSGSIGDSTDDVQLTCSRFEYKGSTAAAFIDLEASNITAIIYGTGAPTSTGLRALYLIGSNLAELIIVGGYVGLAARHLQTATAASVRLSGGNLVMGNGATVTAVENHGGGLEVAASLTTASQYSGSMTMKETAAITTLTIEGGTVTDGSSGTITTLNLNDGDIVVSYGITKTITTLNQDAGSVSYDPNNVTITTHNIATDNVPAVVTVTEA